MDARAVAGQVSHAGLAGLHAQPQDAAGRCGDRAPLHQCVPLANITRQLDRRLHWDPEAERFTGDAEANDRVTRQRRKGYELPEIG